MKINTARVIAVTLIYLLLLSTSIVFGSSVSKVVIVERASALSAVNAKTVAKELLTPTSYSCWLKLTTLESHLNPKAKNPYSSARGIGQLLTSTYKSLGMRHVENSDIAQLVAQLAYINRHFGGNAVCSAYRYELKHHNY